jgi:hypothetical protein
MNRFTRNVQHGLATLALALIVPSLAHAQASRTWVSGVGADENPCSRTAPCKTFAGAISKTAAGGEISVLDPGGYGALTITKAITLNGDGTLASILVSGTNGIVINAGVNDTVIIRNLSFNGIGTGTNGINFLAGGSLLVEKCSFYGFITNTININATNGPTVTVKDTSLQGLNQGQGIAIAAAVNTLKVSVRNTSIRGFQNAVHSVAGTTDISDSLITENTSAGVLADSVSIVSVVDSVVSNNSTGVQVQPSATLRLSNSDFYDNVTHWTCNGGPLLSNGNNRKGGGGAGCGPTGSILVQ